MQIKFIKFLSFVILVLCCAHGAGAVEKYDYDAMAQYAEQAKSTPNIKFVAVCENDNGGYCVRDAFAKTNVQMLQATALAQEYARIKNKHDVICSGNYRRSWNDDYVKCTDKQNKYFYEFRFDDVKESFDSEIRNSVWRAICEMHGGSVPDARSDTCDVATSGVCSNINNSLAKFGYSAKFIDIANGVRGCQVSFGAKNAETYELKTAFGVNNKKFVNLQIQSGADLQFLLRRYTAAQMEKSGATMNSFKCNSGFQTYYIDTFKKDDILTCYANNQPIDFVFDDANEMVNITASGGTAGLQCIADQGGVFDGKNCHGLTQTQCSAISSKITGGTHWDTTLDTCVLNSAATAEKLDKVTDVATTIGVGMAVAAVSVATGGSASAIILVVVGTSLTTAGTMVDMNATSKKTQNIREFLSESAKCKNAQCAQDNLGWFLTEAVQYYDDMGGQVLSALDSELARLMNLIPVDAEIYQRAIEHAIADSQDVANYANWSAVEKQSFYGKILVGAGLVFGLAGGKGLIGSLKTQGKNVMAVFAGKIKPQTVVSMYSNYKKQKGIVTTTQRVINSANVTVNNLESASGLMPTGLITTTGQTATSLIPSLPGA